MHSKLYIIYTSSIFGARGEGGAKKYISRERENLYSILTSSWLLAAAGSFLSFIRDVTDEKEKGGETHTHTHKAILFSWPVMASEKDLDEISLLYSSMGKERRLAV